MARVALAILTFAAWSVSAAPANSCADPHWKDTLRCALFPNEVPQPNVDEIPRGQQVPAYTRVFLDDDPDVRCTDGTMPLIYVDKAVCTEATCGSARRGEPIESNRWIFTMTGGDSCFGERCAFFYAQPDERAFMGTSTKGPVRDFEGILDPDPLRNPLFASYNRVRVEKCSFDRYMGRSQEKGIRATLPNGQTISFNAYHHGFFILQETFRKLEQGLRYPTWRRNAASQKVKRRACCGARGGDQWSSVDERLPALADAEVVLFVGHSNASHGLFHNIDHLAAELPNADVRALFDENFLPGIENEAAGKDAYDGVWSGTSSARGEAFSYDGAVHHATNDVDLSYAAHGAAHDLSCVDAHASDNTAWKCQDRQHVLLNHISTPFMVRQDFTDPNREHLDAPNGHWVRWGNAANYSYCPDAQPCEPRFNAAEFRTRLEKQIQTLLTAAWTRSEIARGVDRSGAVQTTMFVWMPACGQHDGAYSDNPFYGATITTSATSFTMRQWLEEFMAAPRSGVRRYQIDGALDPAGRRMATAQCQQ